MISMQHTYRFRIRARSGANASVPAAGLPRCAPYAARTEQPHEPPALPPPADPAALDNPYTRYYGRPRSLAELLPRSKAER